MGRIKEMEEALTVQVVIITWRKPLNVIFKKLHEPISRNILWYIVVFLGFSLNPWWLSFKTAVNVNNSFQVGKKRSDQHINTSKLCLNPVVLQFRNMSHLFFISSHMYSSHSYFCHFLQVQTNTKLSRKIFRKCELLPPFESLSCLTPLPRGICSVSDILSVGMTGPTNFVSSQVLWKLHLPK